MCPVNVVRNIRQSSIPLNDNAHWWWRNIESVLGQFVIASKHECRVFVTEKNFVIRFGGPMENWMIDVIRDDDHWYLVWVCFSRPRSRRTRVTRDWTIVKADKWIEWPIFYCNIGCLFRMCSSKRHGILCIVHEIYWYDMCLENIPIVDESCCGGVSFWRTPTHSIPLRPGTWWRHVIMSTVAEDDDNDDVSSVRTSILSETRVVSQIVGYESRSGIWDTLLYRDIHSEILEVVLSISTYTFEEMILDSEIRSFLTVLNMSCLNFVLILDSRFAKSYRCQMKFHCSEIVTIVCSLGGRIENE